MIDKRYQRKPSKSHPWVGWRPGLFSKQDKEKRGAGICPRCGYLVCRCKTP